MGMKYRMQYWSALVLVVSATVSFTSRAAQNVTLAWQPNSGSQAAGFFVYWGSASGVYTNRVNVGTNTAFTVSGLLEGVTYYFSTSAYNVGGIESALTSEVPYLVPGILILSPQSTQGTNSMRIQFPVVPAHQYVLQTSADLAIWTNLWVTPVQSTNGWVEFVEPRNSTIPKRFYRLLTN